jgi:hypothetical protein
MNSREIKGREIEEDRMTYEMNRSLLTGFFPFPFGVSTHICRLNEIMGRASDRVRIMRGDRADRVTADRRVGR